MAGTKTFDYTYDPVGNRLSKTEDGGITTYTYDANDRLLSTAGAEVSSFSYDLNGNTLSKNGLDGLTSYSYDAENRLIQAITPQANLAYRYDEAGIRIAEIVNGVTTRHLVDTNRDYAQVLEEIDATDQLIASYLHGDDLISMERLDPEVPGTFAYHFYHYDGHGSVTGLSDATETLTDTYTYEAWGTVLARTGTTENRYQYTGEQYDPNLGFTYLRARYYNPTLGRFHTMDTWQGNSADPITLHKYLYANANPVMLLDPSGTNSIGEIMVGIRANELRLATAQAGYFAFRVATAFFASYVAFEIGKQAIIAAVTGTSIGAAIATLPIAYKTWDRFRRDPNNRKRFENPKFNHHLFFWFPSGPNNTDKIETLWREMKLWKIKFKLYTVKGGTRGRIWQLDYGFDSGGPHIQRTKVFGLHWLDATTSPPSKRIHIHIWPDFKKHHFLDELSIWKLLWGRIVTK